MEWGEEGVWVGLDGDGDGDGGEGGGGEGEGEVFVGLVGFFILGGFFWFGLSWGIGCEV